MSGLSLQESEQTYLCKALAALPKNSPSVELCKLFESLFSDQGLYAIPPRGSETFEKRMKKLLQVFTDSIHNQYHEGVVLNGPLFNSITESMLARREDVSKVLYRGFAMCLDKFALIFTCIYIRLFKVKFGRI